MSVTWTNLYIDCIGADHYSPESAQYFSALETGLIRVEQRWNGHWLRPPVGMRNDQASHQWIEFEHRRDDGFTIRWDELEPRS